MLMLLLLVVVRSSLQEEQEDAMVGVTQRAGELLASQLRRRSPVTPAAAVVASLQHLGRLSAVSFQTGFEAAFSREAIPGITSSASTNHFSAFGEVLQTSVPMSTVEPARPTQVTQAAQAAQAAQAGTSGEVMDCALSSLQQDGWRLHAFSLAACTGACSLTIMLR